MPPSPVPKRETFKVPQAFAQALALHTQGHLNEAERIYSEVLAHRPDHFDALQMLSVIKLAKGEPGEALRLISQAMRMRKPSPQILRCRSLVSARPSAAGNQPIRRGSCRSQAGAGNRAGARGSAPCLMLYRIASHLPKGSRNPEVSCGL
jgi:hypothetical protein